MEHTDHKKWADVIDMTHLGMMEYTEMDRSWHLVMFYDYVLVLVELGE